MKAQKGLEAFFAGNLLANFFLTRQLLFRNLFPNHDVQRYGATTSTSTTTTSTSTSWSGPTKATSLFCEDEVPDVCLNVIDYLEANPCFVKHWFLTTSCGQIDHSKVIWTNHVAKMGLTVQNKVKVSFLVPQQPTNIGINRKFWRGLVNFCVS